MATTTAALVGLGTAALGLAAAAVRFIADIVQTRAKRDPARELPEAAPITISTDLLEDPPRPPKVLLPARSYFINREHEMRDALTRISEGRESVLAIEGGLGIGKSATATELAHCLLDEPPAHTLDVSQHTFLWVDGRNACPSLIDICRQLSLLTGDQSLSTAADDFKIEKLRAHLAGSRTVLVLDNLRLSNDPESTAVREFLRTVPNGSLVIASVNRPGDLEASRVPLGDLDVSHARELIQYHVRRLNLQGPEQFDEAFAKRLYRLIGGNPGAIAWFLRGYSRSSQSLEDRLVAVEQGKGLPELFARIWGDLAENCRMLLSACAYLHGQATAEQLALACHIPRADVHTLAEELLREGLVGSLRVAERPIAYTCAQAFQRFALAETTPETRSAFTDRLASHYVDYFTTNWEDASAAIPEIGALLAVQEWLFAQQRDIDLQALFRATLDILFTLGLFDDRLAAARLAYESARRSDNHRCASVASSVLACTYAIRGEAAKAREALAHGLLAAERSRAPGEIARQMRCTGFLHYRSRKPHEALRAIDGADDRAREGSDLETVVNILLLRAAAHWYLREPEESETAAQRCLEVCAEMGWRRAEAYPLRHLAEIAIHRGLFKEAEELLKRARDVAVSFEDRRQLARVDLTEARLHLLGGTLHSAEGAASRAVSGARRLGLPPEEEEAAALLDAVQRAKASHHLRRQYASERPMRLTDAPVAGD